MRRKSFGQWVMDRLGVTENSTTWCWMMWLSLGRLLETLFNVEIPDSKALRFVGNVLGTILAVGIVVLFLGMPIYGFVSMFTVRFDYGLAHLLVVPGTFVIFCGIAYLIDKYVAPAIRYGAQNFCPLKVTRSA